MRTSPTQRSLKHLRAAGYTAGVTEKWVNWPPPGHRVDLFGFVDILAVGPGETIAVQACAGSSAAARVSKILAEPRFLAVKQAGWKVVVHAWRKAGARGKRKLWDLREIVVEPETAGAVA